MKKNRSPHFSDVIEKAIVKIREKLKRVLFSTGCLPSI
jgi:hypothetical protein